jgi:hypothetical protein
VLPKEMAKSTHYRPLPPLDLTAGLGLELAIANLVMANSGDPYV